MQQRNTTLTSPSWLGVMTSVFAFSGVHTNPNMETHRAFFFIHPGTWFQKSAFSGSENARSVWTVGRNAQDFSPKNRFRMDRACLVSKETFIILSISGSTSVERLIDKLQIHYLIGEHKN